VDAVAPAETMLPPPPPSPLPLHGGAVQATRDGVVKVRRPPPPPPPRLHGLAAASSAAPGLIQQTPVPSTGPEAAAQPSPPPPPLQSCPASSFCPEELLQKMRTRGVRFVVKHHWNEVEALQQEEKFSIAQIAAIFAQCSKIAYLDDSLPRHLKVAGFGGENLPRSTKLVQLFSNYVCERIPELTPYEITTFAEALTSVALPMDEFWLFMMAKRVQDTADAFTAEQILSLAQRYADKSLEDEEFFGALCMRVLSGLREFGPRRLAYFLFACAKLRYRHEELYNAAFPFFEDSMLSTDTLSVAIASAGLLDLQMFNWTACCKALASAPADLRVVVEGDVEQVLGLALAVVTLRHAAVARLLLPELLQVLTKMVDSRDLRSPKSRRESGRIYRRFKVLGLCAAFGVPRRGTWPLSRLRELCAALGAADDRWGHSRSAYEPISSSFHLEVAAVLQLVGVPYKNEHKQSPFMLDLMLDANATSKLEAANAGYKIV